MAHLGRSSPLGWLDPTADARFASRVGVPDFITGCWPWNGTREKGYGQFYVGKSNGISIYARAHRIAYARVHGYIPAGLLVMHSCDNPPCVNPEHLSVGTDADNVRDRDTRCRGYHGERHHSARLSEQDVRDIRRDETSTTTWLAKKYGVRWAAIDRARRGVTWRHLWDG